MPQIAKYLRLGYQGLCDHLFEPRRIVFPIFRDNLFKGRNCLFRVTFALENTPLDQQGTRNAFLQLHSLNVAVSTAYLVQSRHGISRLAVGHQAVALGDQHHNGKFHQVR